MPYEVGQRIELVYMADDPAPIESGTQGTIRRVTELSFTTPPCVQLGVDWDNGRTLMPCVPPDSVRVIG